MDYELSDAHKLIRNTAKRIAREKVAPRAAELDESGIYPEAELSGGAKGALSAHHGSTTSAPCSARACSRASSARRAPLTLPAGDRAVAPP